MTRTRANDEARAEVTARRLFRGRRGRPHRQPGPVKTVAFRPVRSAAAGPAAIATVLAALTAAFGGTPASAAALHASAKAAHVAPARPATVRGDVRRGDARRSAAGVSGVTWHALRLLNGWRSDQGTLNSGNPSWAVKGGVVYLSGSLHQPTGHDPEFAVLPAAARPARTLFLAVYTANGGTATMTILPTGLMRVISAAVRLSDTRDLPALMGAQDYTSLAGVSFPAAATAGHKLSLLNGWQSGLPGYGTGAPAYTVTGGVVHLAGGLHQTTGTNDEFAVLPATARPARVLYLTVSTFVGNTGVLQINPDGEMSAYLGNAQSFTSLAGVSFPVAASPVHKLSLLNGWQSSQSAWDSGDPGYTVTGGVVHLSGSMHQQAGSNLVFAVLPPAARPRHRLWITTYTFDGAVGALRITPAGVMSAFNAAGNAAQAYTSLAGIAYPLGS
jgi:hypothetical protein